VKKLHSLIHNGSHFVCVFFASLLFLKIDKDGDNRVSPAELQSWMRHVQRQSMDADRDKQWAEMNSQDPDLLTWDEYFQHTYKDNNGVYHNCYHVLVAALFWHAGLQWDFSSSMHYV